MRSELVCVAPATPPCLEVRRAVLRPPGPGEVHLRVLAAAVNPIDVKRAAGYGRRLLSLKGAGRFPLVLGNDLAGRVLAVGPGVTRFQPGQAVYGLLATGRGGGSHASEALVPETQLLPAPAGVAASDLALLPYSFVTAWLALQGIGLTPQRAAARRVLIHGASGGLGRLATALLASWGARVTAICGRGQGEVGLQFGAEQSLERGPGRIEALPNDFDAVLNFASWEADALLTGKLAPAALGQATTVHPLLGHFDRLGWLGGAWASRRDWRAARQRVRARAPEARYAWTVFRPDPQALQALAACQRELTLPTGIARPLEQAADVFDHVATGRPGRGLLLP